MGGIEELRFKYDALLSRLFKLTETYGDTVLSVLSALNFRV